MLTNPIFYKIEMVCKAQRVGTARGKQVKASRTTIETRWDEQYRQTPSYKGRPKARQFKKAHK